MEAADSINMSNLSELIWLNQREVQEIELLFESSSARLEADVPGVLSDYIRKLKNKWTVVERSFTAVQNVYGQIDNKIKEKQVKAERRLLRARVQSCVGELRRRQSELGVEIESNISESFSVMSVGSETCDPDRL